MSARRTALAIRDADAAEIGELYRTGKRSLVDSVKRFVEAGQRLTAKKASLTHGEWLPWLEGNADTLDFDTPRTAQRLMRLAANATPTSHLDEAEAIAISRDLWGNDADDPNDRNDADLDSLLRDEQGHLTPKAREFIREVRAEKTASKKAIRSQREAALGGKLLALPEKKYGVIYADPEWHFVVGSDAWMSTSHAANHYPTSPTEEIADRPVADIAADDAVLYLWATVPMLPDALLVMQAWGFRYVSNFVWVKDRTGTGYWNQNQHELLLIGTRGNVPAPAPGTQWPSVIEAPRGRHSEKPERVYELIEHYFPTLPKIELNARKRRDGWDAWGFEAPADDDLAIPAYLRRAQA
ncbi:MAG: MT-A70 family methyltransferase [Rhizomicrobium sp.]